MVIGVFGSLLFLVDLVGFLCRGCCALIVCVRVLGGGGGGLSSSSFLGWVFSWCEWGCMMGVVLLAFVVVFCVGCGA